MRALVVIAIVIAGAAAGFFAGYRFACVLKRQTHGPIISSPVMSHREAQELRETVLALLAKVKRLEQQARNQELRRTTAR